jgi:hypothetical protein
MQKPNLLDYPRTTDGHLRYETYMEVWRSQQREKLKRSDEQSTREQFAPPPDTVQLSRAEYEALRRDAERYRYALDHLRSWDLSVKGHYGLYNENLTSRIDAAINMPTNGEGETE